MSTKDAQKDNKKTPATVSELPDGPADDNGLTTRQQLILEVIKQAILTNGYPPSMREIGQAAGLASPRFRQISDRSPGR